jgi:hypothetical protein
MVLPAALFPEITRELSYGGTLSKDGEKRFMCVCGLTVKIDDETLMWKARTLCLIVGV